MWLYVGTGKLENWRYPKSAEEDIIKDIFSLYKFYNYIEDKLFWGYLGDG